MNHTALYEEHKKLNARIVDFAGYAMPVQYEGVIAEHKNVRECVGVFDVSHMGWVSFEAKNVCAKLNHLFTKDLERALTSQAQYNIMCYENGGTVDDLILYKESENKVYAVFNASNKEKDLRHIKENLKEEVAITEHFDSHSILAIQGPKSLELLKAHGFEGNYKFMSFLDWSYKGHETKIAFSGYTGEMGLEWIIPNSLAVEAWQDILEVGKQFGVKACGLAARDTLRTEMGFSLYGHELSENIDPVTAGLNWAISFKKEEFIGKEALLRIKEKPENKIICLSAETKRGPRPGTTVLNASGQEVGSVSSGTFSPSLGHAIAMAFVKSDSEPPYSLEFRNESVEFKISKRPFYTR